MHKATSAAAIACFLGSSLLAQDGSTAKEDTVKTSATAPAHENEGVVSIGDAIRAADPDVQEFNEHLMVLASPWMEGRLPGTRGFERASEYMEDHFKQIGLLAPVESNGNKTYRHVFDLASKAEITGVGMSLKGAGGDVELVDGEDFTMTSYGTAKELNAVPMVFVGYGINEGPGEYETFGEKDDLSGKVAVVYRFEPMNDDGSSKWSQRGWSRSSTFSSKLTNVMKHKPEAIVVINPPGAADPRAKTLIRQGTKLVDVPVYMMSPEGADKLFKAADDEGRSAQAMRELADAKGVVMELPKGTVSLKGKIEQKPVQTANVIGLLPGKGTLKDEYIVIGGHLDHLGQGMFGSREGAGKLHPGADDNASGSAGVIMLAESLSDEYKKLKDDEPARSILFMGFSAEESGLNGSEAYVNAPVFPLDKTVLMFNFDMIGRIKGKRLSVSGTDTGKGMHEWSQPFLTPEKSGLTVVQSKRTGAGGSDHTSFVMKNIPVLFGIIADINTANPDYHTSRDTTEKINREDAVLAIKLWHELALSAALRPERFEFNPAAPGEGGGGGAARAAPKVRFGVVTEEVGDSLRVREVVEGASADLAGMKVGDVIVKFNKLDLKDRNGLMTQLLELSPDDTVQVVVQRDGQEQTLFVKMQARK